ncbi:hypothetical protein [Nocardioides sp. B-3]|uniref:hypothetical protein n=1 Tax=Nocardioides sp. B-3 TaxID=2895565 RepID=UPI002153422C|nr:hypothetical protein [Nocardioides sp. B-3]UUZ61284.1 hypothetical protein LP418_12220 [Nocardioides sp. B-3]
MSTPIEFFRSVAAEHRRCFWLDGGGGARVVRATLADRLARRGRRVVDLLRGLAAGHSSRGG